MVCTATDCEFVVAAVVIAWRGEGGVVIVVSVVGGVVSVVGGPSEGKESGASGGE